MTKTSCKYCSGGEVLWSQTHDVKLYISTGDTGTRVILTECDPCPDSAVCGLKHVPTRSVTLINFCPVCGRKVNKEDKYE